MIRSAVRQILLGKNDEREAKRIIKKYGLTVFDPSPTTCYSDSAGSTPAVQDGTVGCIVDSQATLGPDRVVNGGFDLDTAWNKGAGWSISGGVATITSSAGTNSIIQGSLVTAGKLYSITYTIVSVSAQGFRAFCGGNQGPLRTAPGTYTENMVAGGAISETGVLTSAAGTTGSIDNISVREVIGYIATQSTTGFKPKLRNSGGWYLESDADDLLTMTAIPGATSATIIKSIRNSAQTTQTGVDCSTGLVINTNGLTAMMVSKNTLSAADLKIMQKYIAKLGAS